jgi:superfamily I DNA and/or RNA helicase
MHPDIRDFVSRKFYAGALTDAPTVTLESHRRDYHALPGLGPYVFHNVAAGNDTAAVYCSFYFCYAPVVLHDA